MVVVDRPAHSQRERLRPRAGWRHARVVWLIALLVCGAATTALARGGGGQGYHGGGSPASGGGGWGGGSSGYDGGGGGGVDIGPLLFWGGRFCLEHPIIAVALILLVIYVARQASQEGADRYRTQVIRRYGGQLAEERRAAALNRLKSVDPQFDPAAFCGRAQDAFIKLQQAWSNQDLAPVGPFVSDGICERFLLQFAEQRDFNYRNQVDRVEVREVQLIQVAGDSLFDLLTVAIRAAADDYRVTLDTGRRLAEGATQEEFIEYWTFLRRRGVLTEARPGLIEGCCPNCGAPIEINASAKCAACSSLVRSGKFDWVLVEITQAAEWHDDEPPEPAGVAAWRAAHDPGFNVEHLEDRASVIFWRKTMADRQGDTRPLAKVATEAFCQQYPQFWSNDKSGRRYWGDCAVGSVDTLGILPGETFDRVLVEVRWAGHTFFVAAGSRPQPVGENALLRSLFVLCRRCGVRSAVDTSVTSAHCPSCGAPEGNLAADACEFCGAVLNDGSHDFVLAELWPLPSAEADALIGQLPPTENPFVAGQPVSVGEGQAGPIIDALAVAEPAAAFAEPLSSKAAPAAPFEIPRSKELLAWAIQMALADQQLSAAELKALARAGARRGVSVAQVETLITAAQAGQLATPQPQSRDEGVRWLTAMADIALADGKIEPPEARLLLQAGQQLGWSQADVRRLLAQRKTELYRAARAGIKNRSNPPRPGDGSGQA